MTSVHPTRQREFQGEYQCSKQWILSSDGIVLEFKLRRTDFNPYLIGARITFWIKEPDSLCRADSSLYSRRRLLQMKDV